DGAVRGHGDAVGTRARPAWRGPLSEKLARPRIEMAEVPPGEVGVVDGAIRREREPARPRAFRQGKLGDAQRRGIDAGELVAAKFAEEETLRGCHHAVRF